ncbi:unnamed protein product [Darwinula stevensoni]|uniref:Thioredoxin domain-containing protein 9 n=1 Tax=Darwinula stevensoni TaxID=69355 RepID=A0A7R8ZZZ5_9CRUS|nr:unnamed protein product [Darwinula stevensoni]CAG0879906.1 unnamed protein product [Darwinula stevensoni]
MEKVIEQQLAKNLKVVEDFVDAEIERIDKMDGEELDAIRNQRLEALKKQAEQKQHWKQQGHGGYSELPEEKEFFNVTKQSENVICHFYRDSAFRCKIVDKHLNILAPKHIEARFIKLNADKTPFLAERLKIRVIPTILLVKNGKTKDYIVGFTDLGNHDEFSTEMLEWRIAQADVIEYNGDLLTPPDASKSERARPSLLTGKKKTIREKGGNSDESDDDDW